MGNIDIVTLEGLIILEHIENQPEEFQAELKKLSKENMTLKEKRPQAPLPFSARKQNLYYIRGSSFQLQTVILSKRVRRQRPCGPPSGG